MSLKKASLILGVIIIILGAGVFAFLSRQPKSQETPLSPVSAPSVSTKILPSSTLKEYTDPSGFSFTYPDDLSLMKKETADDLTYADLELKSKEVNGSLDLKIQDTKLTSAEEWFKESKKVGIEGKQVQWGLLNGQSVEDKDGIIFAAVDQGVIFTMEVSYGGQKDFWQKVAEPILSSFAFNSETPQTTAQTGSTSSEDVIFEGEEIVE